MKTPFLSFIYLVCVAIFVSATHTHNNTTTAAENIPTIVKAKSHNYIVQVSRETKLEAFMDEFSKKVEDFFHELFEDIKDGFEDLFSRDDEVNYQLHRSYDIGGSYKAIGVRIKDGRVVDKIPHHFKQVVSIIPDDEITFDLGIPRTRKIDKRYYIRSVAVKNATNYHDSLKDNGSIRPVRPSRANATKTKKSAATKKTASATPTATKTLVAPLGSSKNQSYLTQTPQKSTPWNLIRISERKRDFSKPYVYDSRAGKNVTVYVVDDGINISHEDFEGRARYGYSAFPTAANTPSTTSSSSSSSNSSSSPQDGGGHGTHVAGIIGGKTYGVAKKVKLVSVQVLKANGKGTISSLLGGIQWIIEHSKKATGPILINMSLGINNSVPGSKSLEEAVTAAVDAGVPIIAAAGNSASDACDIIPAGNSKVFAVGTVTKEDKMDALSCYGKCVDILAPGFNITSAYVGGPNATAVLSGTSMASPHVAGTAALLLPYMADATPQELYDQLTKLATDGVITEIPDNSTPNKLIFNGQEMKAEDAD